jgi:hypothetical protein
MEAHPLDWSTFAERMDDAKQTALQRTERLAYLGARVTWKQPSLILWRTVADVAAELGVSHSRVKLLIAQGRFGKCRRNRTVKAHPWLIPAHRTPSGDYQLRLSPGTRGPKLRLALSPVEEVPF